MDSEDSIDCIDSVDCIDSMDSVDCIDSADSVDSIDSIDSHEDFFFYLDVLLDLAKIGIAEDLTKLAPTVT